MTVENSKGLVFREAIKNNSPLQIVGTVNAYSSLLAEKSSESLAKLLQKQRGFWIGVQNVFLGERGFHNLPTLGNWLEILLINLTLQIII